MNSIRRAQLLGQIITRNVSQSAVKNQVQLSARAQKLRDLQTKYQVDDGVPSFLKGGLKDKILYQLTIVMTLIAMGMSGEVLYNLTWPKKD